eukprot:TRINITY_DN680_c0_g1_i1.p1 TRINITY_DN680_c0_g1~~TRINITY_DN680_c0_g1_i1.p1  ORF type:complete len:185 (-),score=54.35 TRINITY_DN680_c0_g1_i1:18-545(-)
MKEISVRREENKKLLRENKDSQTNVNSLQKEINDHIKLEAKYKQDLVSSSKQLYEEQEQYKQKNSDLQLFSDKIERERAKLVQDQAMTRSQVAANEALVRQKQKQLEEMERNHEEEMSRIRATYPSIFNDLEKQHPQQTTSSSVSTVSSSSSSSSIATSSSTKMPVSHKSILRRS